MRDSLNSACVTVLLLLGGILRWPTLNSPLAGDEELSFSRYGHLPWDELLFVYRDPNQHTLFSLLSNFCMAVLGENEIAFRTPSFLAGILAPIAVYYLGRRLFDSPEIAFAGGSLLALSGPSIEYSQLGRGYALTLFLAPVLILCCLRAKHLFSKETLAFLLVGFSLVLALPSNVMFLFAIGVWVVGKNYSIIRKWDATCWEELRSVVFSWSVLFLGVGAYLFCIREGLQQGAQLYASDPLDLHRWIDVAVLLVQPWGVSLYLLVVCFKEKKQSLLFAAIFLAPLLLSMFMGIGGYSRTYLFWLPFLLLIIGASGVVLAKFLISKNKLAGWMASAVLLVFLLVPVGQFLSEHYQNRESVAAGTMAAAREMAHFVHQEVSAEALLLIVSEAPQGGLIGTHLKQRVEHGMRRIAAGNLPQMIYFVGHRDAMPDRKPIGDYYRARSITLPSNLLHVEKEIGNMVLCRFNVSIQRFLPTPFDPDNLEDLSPFATPELSMERTREDRALGEDALKFLKKGSDSLLIESRKKIAVNIDREGSFLLQIYIRKYGQRSRMLMSAEPLSQWPPAAGYLNPYFGAFRVGEEVWQSVMLLTPVSAGRNAFRPVFHLDDEESYFDAWQTFLLSSGPL
ncbi:MAG: hypothetical protein COV66_13765 [Nitrospinae bacterium CG11_big_fil_rev_8_21_14_0_20_45_15]|nr:MAG: hypothetical protein COV66_13765 [Nitrospinae bacterium CG11_big_fil_rev_8_21_14_0_20_45_15]